MNILNIIQCTNLGGMEKSSLRLMVELKQRGHSIRLLSLNPIGKLENLNIAHILVEALHFGYWYLKLLISLILLQIILLVKLKFNNQWIFKYV